MEKDTDFEKFIDDFVREKTGFNSARELLESKPNTRFIYITIAIGCLIAIPLPVAIILTLPCAYLIAKFIQKVKMIKCTNKYYGNFSIDLDTDDLILFLNNKLKYLKPYCNEWSYFYERNRYMGIGIVSAVGAAALNTIAKKAEEARKVINIATGFGEDADSFLVIRMRKDYSEQETDEKIYYFDVVRNQKSLFFSSLWNIPLWLKRLLYYKGQWNTI